MTKLKWKNAGGGSFRLSTGKIIKSGQVFAAPEEKIPKSFRDVIICLEKSELKENKVIPGNANKYEIVSKGVGWYNVVDSDGKVINSKSLRKEEAEKLLNELS